MQREEFHRGEALVPDTRANPRRVGNKVLIARVKAWEGCAQESLTGAGAANGEGGTFLGYGSPVGKVVVLGAMQQRWVSPAVGAGLAGLLIRQKSWNELRKSVNAASRKYD